MTIYIAEDDLGLARGMKFTLEKEGYQAETFPSLRLLTEAIQTELPGPSAPGLESPRRGRSDPLPEAERIL